MKRIIIIMGLCTAILVAHTVDTEGTNTKHTIKVADGWIRVASKGDTINISNESNANAVLQPVDAKPMDTVKWGLTLYLKQNIPYFCTHDLYVRAIHATTIVVITKD